VAFLRKCTKDMSEENEVTFEQLQKMAAEQDRADGEEVGDISAEVPPAEIAAGKEPQEGEPPGGKEPEEKPESKPDAEDDEEPIPDLAEGPPDVDSSLKDTVKPDRFSKSESRLNDSWRKLNAKKGEVEEMRQEVEELRGLLNSRAKPDEFVDQDGSTVEDYEAAAKSFTLDGEHDLAKEAEKQAELVRTLGRKNQIEKVNESFKKEWGDNFNKAADSYPELRENDSGFKKAVYALLHERPVLSTYSGGIIDAADIVAMKVESEKSGELRHQISELSEENAGLKSKLSIGGSEPTGGPTGKREFNDMSTKEQFAELQRRAHEADSALGY